MSTILTKMTEGEFNTLVAAVGNFKKDEGVIRVGTAVREVKTLKDLETLTSYIRTVATDSTRVSKLDTAAEKARAQFNTAQTTATVAKKPLAQVAAVASSSSTEPLQKAHQKRNPDHMPTKGYPAPYVKPVVTTKAKAPESNSPVLSTRSISSKDRVDTKSGCDLDKQVVLYVGNTKSTSQETSAPVDEEVGTNFYALGDDLVDSSANGLLAGLKKVRDNAAATLFGVSTAYFTGAEMVKHLSEETCNPKMLQNLHDKFVRTEPMSLLEKIAYRFRAFDKNSSMSFLDRLHQGELGEVYDSANPLLNNCGENVSPLLNDCGEKVLVPHEGFKTIATKAEEMIVPVDNAGCQAVNKAAETLPTLSDAVEYVKAGSQKVADAVTPRLTSLRDTLSPYATTVATFASDHKGTIGLGIGAAVVAFSAKKAYDNRDKISAGVRKCLEFIVPVRFGQVSV